MSALPCLPVSPSLSPNGMETPKLLGVAVSRSLEHTLPQSHSWAWAPGKHGGASWGEIICAMAAFQGDWAQSPMSPGGLRSLLPGAEADGLLSLLLLMFEPNILRCSDYHLNSFFMDLPPPPPRKPQLHSSSPRKGVGFSNFLWRAN